jgi:hypothetical protein
MLYTRRKLIRQSAVVSLAGAASASLPFLTGCREGAFPYGVRIFFLGAWLFGVDPADTSRVLAHSVDMEKPMHNYPYGPWKGGDFDKGKQLYPNPPSGQTTAPYQITINGRILHQPKSTYKLFSKTASANPFMWMPAMKMKPDMSDLTTVRRISTPIPTRILTCDFLDESYIYDNGHVVDSQVTIQTGAPGGFIFDYQGADSLSFSVDESSVSGSTTSDADYHFRTVPYWPPGTGADGCHPQKMFSHQLEMLVNFGQSQPPTLSMNCSDNKVIPGKYVPVSVSNSELDISPPPLRSLTTASCAGGGGAVGGHR